MSVCFVTLLSSSFCPWASCRWLSPFTPLCPALPGMHIGDKRKLRADRLSLSAPQAWTWRPPHITCRPRPMCASSRSSTTRTSSLSSPTSWRLIVSESLGAQLPPPRSLAPGTQALCTMPSTTHIGHLSPGASSYPTRRIGLTYQNASACLSVLLRPSYHAPPHSWFLTSPGEVCSRDGASRPEQEGSTPSRIAAVVPEALEVFFSATCSLPPHRG